MIRILLLLSVILAPLGASSLASESDDPRLEQASQLLSSSQGYPEAERLFREILEDDPLNRSARLNLARLLSWIQRYAESIGEYDRLVQADPSNSETRLERAEVLSWSGHYSRAESDFRLLLDADATNARAARGLARVYLWSGALYQADQMFDQALALEDDPEARQEWRELRAMFGPHVELLTSSLSDNARYDQFEHFVQLEKPLGLRTRMRARLGLVRVSHPQSSVDARIRSDKNRDRATELAAAVERRFNDRWKAGFEAGLRAWRHATDRPFGRAEVEYAPNSETAFGLHLARTDQLDISHSFEALQKGLRQAEVGLSLWKSLGPQLESYGSIELSQVTDGNQRRSMNGSLSSRPWPDRELWLHLYGNYMGYEDAALEYYDPESDLGSTLAFEHHLPLHPTLRLEYGGGLGLGRADTRASTESGGLLSAKGRLVWKRHLWSGLLGAEVMRSQRSQHYRETRFRLEIKRVF